MDSVSLGISSINCGINAGVSASTSLNKQNPEVPIQIIAKDCVNGTLMPKEKFSSRIETNYTEVNRVFQEQGYRYKLDTDEQKIPYDTDIIIYDKTKVNFISAGN